MKAKLGSILLLGALAAGCGDNALTQTGVHGLVVQASLSAVSLSSYECPERSDADAPGGGAGFAPCEQDAECPSFCQQSNMQIDLAAQDGDSAVPFQVVAVRIYRSGEDTVRDELTARTPRKWATDGYEAWSESIAPSVSLKVSYDLTAPDWSTVETTDSSRLSGNGPTYRIEVDVLIDGVKRTLSLDGVTREPEVAT